MALLRLLGLSVPLLLLACVSVRSADVRVNLSSSHPISRLVYGANYASSTLLSWGVGVNRNGGDAQSNWNWQLDATNSGADWYFLSNPQSDAYPDGSTNDLLMDATFAARSTYVTQVSAIGWVTATRQKEWSFSVAHYGAQKSNECIGDGGSVYCAADAGNGVLTDGTVLSNNRTWYQPYSPSDAVSFVAHMRQRASPAVFDPSIIVQLDNEPDIWHETHRDCHPAALTYDELWSYTLNYSLALKAAYPGIAVAGPIWCCWCAYFWSAKDGCGGGEDMAAHDNMFITPWLLQKMNDYYLATGVQLLQYLDIHYYPNVPSDESTQANQQQFTDQVRSFYDPTYPDPGWIGAAGCGASCNGPYVHLIPRFQQWIAQYAPNLTLSLAISEYSFGTDSMFSPMLANAEVLAVMGAHNVAYSSRWTSPTDGSLAENAFRLYLNYDGSGGQVMGDSVPTSSSTATAFSLTAYSVYNSTSRTLFLLLFNLAFAADSAVSVTISSASLASGAASLTASVWQMSAASTALTQQTGVTVTSGGSAGLSLSGYSVPARSATLLVMSGVTQAGPTASSSSSSAPSSRSSSSSSSSPSSPSTASSASSVPLSPLTSVSSSSASSASVATSPSTPSSSPATTAPPSSTASTQTATNGAAISMAKSVWTLMSLALTVCVAVAAAVGL